MKRKHLTAMLALVLSCLAPDAQAQPVAKQGNTDTTIVSVNNPDDRIHIYPNPSRGTFYFNGVRGNTIQVYNLLGQNVYEAEATRDHYPVDLSVKGRGIYTYRVLDEGNIVQQGKVVVE